MWVGRQRRILHASTLMHICTIPAFHCSRSRPLRRQTGCESGSGRSGPSFHTRRPPVLGTHRSGLYWAVCVETSGPTGVGSGSWGVSTLGGFNPQRGGHVVPRLSWPPVYRYLFRRYPPEGGCEHGRQWGSTCPSRAESGTRDTKLCMRDPARTSDGALLGKTT